MQQAMEKKVRMMALLHKDILKRAQGSPNNERPDYSIGSDEEIDFQNNNDPQVQREEGLGYEKKQQDLSFSQVSE